jgi:protease YdgD
MCILLRASAARASVADRLVDRATTSVANAVLVLVFTGSFLGTALGHDPIEVDANEFPWSSVGKIYNSARSSCTGSVIGPDKVLTAAHCLFNRATGRFVQPGSVHFLLGYRGGEYRAHARVAGYLIGANYKPEEASKSVPADWAILTLTTPVANVATPLPLAKKPSAVDERIMVGGFSRMHPFKMTADTDCRVRGMLPTGLMVHDCAVMHGVSGAPLLKPGAERAQGNVEIVGVHVASGQTTGSRAAVAVPVTTFAEQASSPAH